MQYVRFVRSDDKFRPYKKDVRAHLFFATVLRIYTYVRYIGHIGHIGITASGGMIRLSFSYIFVVKFGIKWYNFP